MPENYIVERSEALALAVSWLD